MDLLRNREMPEAVGPARLPAAMVEDMYAPTVRARTAMGQMTIGK
jgi:uncharacterized protein YfaS (alpha-2-macroglobulin family)